MAQPRGVPDGAVLWRRIPPCFVVMDGERCRPSSSAFDEPDMSVAVAEIAGSYDEMMMGHDEYGLVSFPAKLLIDLGFTLQLDETSETYKGHAIAFIEVTRSARKRLAKTIAESAEWVLRPKGFLGPCN